MKRERVKCDHGRRLNECKECGGSGICEHGRLRYSCKDCGGSGRCEHGRVRSGCKDCGGGSRCEHGRLRTQCKDCGGGGDRHARCEHGRQRRFCKDCCGSGLCKQHLRQRCTECKAAAALAAVVWPHWRARRQRQRWRVSSVQWSLVST